MARESRTWDLKSLIHIYSMRYTFKYIYSLWCSLPLAIESKQRGKDAPGSATQTRNLKRTEARKEASSFLTALGLDKPTDKDEWRRVLREMGSFLATKTFLTNCPAPVMEMPVAPVHDSKEAMRFRAICDERITIPLDALKQFPEVRSKLVGQLPQSAMVSPRPHEASAADLPEVQLLWSTLVLTVCLHGAEALGAEGLRGHGLYLLPTISKDFAGLIPRPSGGDQALRWVKDALRRRGVAQEHVTPLTWHSFRVFIPDCAFQLGVPRSERQYLGN